MKKEDILQGVLELEVDGEPCVAVPLCGEAGEDEFALLEKYDWERYLANKYSPKMRVKNQSGIVVTNVRKSAKDRTRETTVARIILDCPEGIRIGYATENKLDLRRCNLIPEKGKGGTLGQRPNEPDARIGSIRKFTPEELADLGGFDPVEAAEIALETVRDLSLMRTSLRLPTDGRHWSAEWDLDQWLEHYDWESDRDHALAVCKAEIEREERIACGLEAEPASDDFVSQTLSSNRAAIDGVEELEIKENKPDQHAMIIEFKPALSAGPLTHKITLHYKPKSRRYSVSFEGRELVSDSFDPEFDACRALLAKGITGRLETWREGTPYPCMILDIELAAKLHTGTNKFGTPTFQKYSSLGLVTAPSSQFAEAA